MRKRNVVTSVLLLAIALQVSVAVAQDASQPIRTSWGRIKVLYGPSVGAPADSASRIDANRTSQPTNAQDRRVGPFPGGDWSSRVLWEARHALSQRNDGSSSSVAYRPWPNNRLVMQYYGDWNYAASDQYALGKVMAESWNQYGNRWPGSWSGSYHYQGTCTWFVREVLYRATYWAGYGWHLTTPGYPGSVYSWCDGAHMTQDYGSARGGWVISSPGVHMAILEARAWDFGGWGWWVIDTNWVGAERLGKHFMTDSQLRAGNYWAWCPTWATTN